MGDPSLGTPSAGPTEDRLDSWKEIAVYLNRDVTPVQRWEKREGMAGSEGRSALRSALGSLVLFLDR
jgi:hypothetical protein